MEYIPWRLDTSLLKDEGFCQIISSAIDEFLEFNRSDDVSPTILWETLKVVIRGKIISYKSMLNKSRRLELERLINAIQVLDSQYSASPCPELYKEKMKLQELLASEKIERMLLKSRGIMYEHGEKSSRLLAHQLKSRSSEQHITCIMKDNGELTVDPIEINGTFQAFYSKLYSSEAPEDNTLMDDFFSNLNMPKIHAVSRAELEFPVSSAEIEDAIRAMQNGKAPGPDGYPVEFFKKFSEQLVPLLQEMFAESKANGTLPKTLTEASIILLLKPGKDKKECGSYRPISLLNCDIKTLSKVLANRLDKVMPEVISSDQTGFMLACHSFSNVRRLLNVLYSPASSAVAEVVISLNAEKAFDKVEWRFLFECLSRFGFGPNFRSWIELLYFSPKASIVTNRNHSGFFPLTRGTRQGSPISPLLFALVIEPLSIALKSKPEVCGIHRGGLTHKLSLYADDLLLYISDPIHGIPHVLNILQTFSVFSGYKLNLTKSECFPVNALARSLQESDFPFCMSRDGFKYLGINLTQTFPELYHKNLVPLVDRLKSDFQRWDAINLTLFGRINCIKMNVLPRFLYFFSVFQSFCLSLFFSLLMDL